MTQSARAKVTVKGKVIIVSMLIKFLVAPLGNAMPVFLTKPKKNRAKGLSLTMR